MDYLYHRPVLLDEVVQMLKPAENKVFLDGTLGGGGHAAALLRKGAIVIAIDKDSEALEAAAKHLGQFADKFIPIKGDFRCLNKYIEASEWDAVDGILLDLGVSSHQLDTAERGFSYRDDAPLDMRMNKKQVLTAAHLINELPERELAALIRKYGEERWSNRIAWKINSYRRQNRIETTTQLADVVKSAIPAAARRSGPHPARRTFQALRIAVNDELGSLEEALENGIKCLRPGGRMAVISYHSLEDRIVKQAFRRGENPCTCPPSQPICNCGLVPYLKVITRHPVCPQSDEISSNPRARSAKLRVAESIGSKQAGGE